MSGKAVIAQQGKTNWCIFNASKNSQTCNFAAAELQRYLSQVIGSSVAESQGSNGKPAFILGLRKDLAPVDLELIQGPPKGFDGYSLAITENRIVIGGCNERGVLYGVYDLLERVGCRWFYPQQDPRDTEVIPHRKDLVLENVKTSIASPIQYRICNASSFFFDIDPTAMKTQLDAAMKARYNGMGWQCDHRYPIAQQYKQLETSGVIAEIKKRGMFLHGPAHSYPHFLPNELFDKHPEWFGMRDGRRVRQEFGGSQFCLSNPEARCAFVKNAETFIRNAPAIDIFCPLPYDGGQFCECSECAKSTPADLIVTLMNELIERLSKTAPKLLVETYGGYNPKDPPINTKPNSKLRVIWAHWGRYHGYGYDDPRYALRENLEKWREFAPGGFTVCQYYTDNFATPWISAPYPIVIKGDRRYIVNKAIEGVYVLHWAKGYWWNHGLNSYLAGRCFYDASLDPYALIRDYALNYFGKDAGELLAAYYIQWATHVDLPYRIKDGTTEADRKMLAEQRKHWLEPAVELTRNDPVLSHRVSKVLKLHRAAEMLAELHKLREDTQGQRKSGNFQNAAKLLQKTKAYTDKVLAYLASIAELNEGLIDRNEVSGFISLALKNWVQAEEQVLSESTLSQQKRDQ